MVGIVHLWVHLCEARNSHLRWSGADGREAASSEKWKRLGMDRLDRDSQQLCPSCIPCWALELTDATVSAYMAEIKYKSFRSADEQAQESHILRLPLLSLCLGKVTNSVLQSENRENASAKRCLHMGVLSSKANTLTLCWSLTASPTLSSSTISAFVWWGNPSAWKRIRGFCQVHVTCSRLSRLARSISVVLQGFHCSAHPCTLIHTSQ